MMPSTLWSFLLLAVFSSLVRAQQTFFPASVPLSIRSPYMSVWYVSKNSSAPISNSWPDFWGQTGIMGWAGKIRVDGKTYAWMGNDNVRDGTANVTNFRITPTRSIFEMQAGPMNLTVTYLSPIEPSDWVKQSLPFSYVSVEATSLDGASHSVQMYSDISAEWVSGDRSSQVQWSSQTTSSSVYHEIELQSPQPNVEISHQAQDGKAYYGMAIRPGLSWQIDGDIDTRTLFKTSGSLSNFRSTAYAPISPNFSVFAIAVELGNIQSTPSPVTWAVGYVRDPSVQYTTPSGVKEQRRPLFTTNFSGIGDAIDAFTGDFSAAHDRAVQLDEQIMGNASKVSQNYVDLVSLATRQVMGSLDITALEDSAGNADASDIKIFMKDIGTSQRVNPVERMFAAFPTYLYLNASLCGALLEPLLEWQDTSSGQQYAAQDLGSAYPLAQGVHGAHNEGIEQTGNMLIMMYAHARFSGDGSSLMKHYNVTKRWADYLVANALTPENQLSADHEEAANLTNLALKGIIGVKAMAEISRAVKQDFDAQQYDSHASSLIGSWQSLAMGSNNHLLAAYGGSSTSWSLIYNMYADRLLGTNIVPQSVVDGETQFYATLLTGATGFGLPIDSIDAQTGSTAWTLLTSAVVSDPGVRNQMIQGVWSRASFNQTLGAFLDQYDITTGVGNNGNAGPAVGAMFSHLALTIPNTTISLSGGGSGTGDQGTNGVGGNKQQSNIGPIVGGVLGGLAVIGIAVAAFLFFRRRRPDQREIQEEKADIFEAPQQPSLSSYFQDTATGPHHGVLSDPQLSPNSGSFDAAGRGTGGAFPFHQQETMLTWRGDVPSVRQGMSAKARERALNNMPQYAASVSGSSAAGTDAPSASSQDPLSLGSTATRSATGSISNSDVQVLRAEVNTLRMVMQQIHESRLDPPPEYAG